MIDYAVIIAAAGASRRMGGSTPKQYLPVDGMPMFVKSVRLFLGSGGARQIIVSCPPGDEAYVWKLLAKEGLRRDDRADAPYWIDVVPGGPERQDTVRLALEAVEPRLRYVLIHDAARPYCPFSVIRDVTDALENGAEAVVPGVTPKNTIRTAEKTLERASLYEVQTPQGFETAALRKALAKAAEEGFMGTDEASVTERAGIGTVVVAGDYANIKITTPEDLPKERKSMRIGTGYDVHRLVEGRPLMLGCVNVPFEKGLLGHSDADVLAHAIADALLGAAALGDIGKIYPDNSPETEGMSGSAILSGVAQLLRKAGFTIVNIDATLVAEKPKVAPFTADMRSGIAAALGISADKVSVKATTEEKLGFTGDGSAMAAQAVALIE
ncbi:MAG: 2-C-methyl-D-erythritol 2,4-cyclodiphosphate synthase [Firmicutes bacterium]|nr:2-C-methyl-D-erythritol 2,4-cyclodiphosphate synthase [Bacillota bacterium]